MNQAKKKINKFLNWRHPGLAANPASRHVRMHDGRVHTLNNWEQLHSEASVPGAHTEHAQSSPLVKDFQAEQAAWL